jgi:hypothetical protein
LDVSTVGHDRYRHVELRWFAVLAWWLLSTEVDLSGWTLKVPGRNSPAHLPLARSGLLTAAQVRAVETVDPAGNPAPLSWQGRQPRLPGANWAVLDELLGEGRLRIIPDLADPRRSIRPRDDDDYRFPWLTNLGLNSAAIDSHDYQRFLADADLVLTELIDNVHRWSRARSALAVVSTTRGSTTRGSWNRLHVIVADAGAGIPAALRADVAALSAVHEASQHPGPLDSLTDADLVEHLMRYAFGDRHVPKHNGQGLNVAQVRAGQWVGAIDVVTVDVAGIPLRKSSHGVNPAVFEGDDAIELPEARGTLIHLTLQATSRRDDAARYEQLELPGSGLALALPSL